MKIQFNIYNLCFDTIKVKQKSINQYFKKNIEVDINNQ